MTNDLGHNKWEENLILLTPLIIDKNLLDLAVEVIFSSGDIEILLLSYRHLKSPEVWIWKNNQITFYYLEEDNYTSISICKILTNLQ